MSAPPPRRIGGLAVVLAIVRNAEPKFRQELLRKLAVASPVIARLAEEFLFIFDDLRRVDDRGLQLLLRTIPEQEWLDAWKMMAKPVQQRLLANMSAARREDFSAAVAALPKLPKVKVLRTQMHIARQVRVMIEAGKVQLRQKPHRHPDPE